MIAIKYKLHSVILQCTLVWTSVNDVNTDDLGSNHADSHALATSTQNQTAIKETSHKVCHQVATSRAMYQVC